MTLSSFMVTGGSQRIPLQRARIDRTRRQLSPSFRELRDAATGSTDPNRLALTSYRGAVYYADINIAGKTYRLIMDTGSTDVWVSCYFVDKTRCVTQCPKTATVISYGSGDVCVLRDLAEIQLGRLTVDGYAVGVAVGTNVVPGDDSILLGDAEGILGLGYPALASYTSPAGFLTTRLTSFSVYLEPNDSAQGSFLLVNEVDDDLIRDNGLVPYTVPLKKATHWTLGITNFQIGKSALISPCATPTSGSCSAIVDTGTSLMLVPPDVFTTLANEYLEPAGCVYSKEVANGGLYVCSNVVELPTLRLTFGNMTFILEKADYIIRASLTSVIVEIQPSSSTGDFSQTWVLGDTFLKKFYTSFIVNESIVLYCKEGETCDRKTITTPSPAPTAKPASGSNSSNSLGSTTTKEDVVSVSTQTPPSAVNESGTIGGSSAIGVTSAPSAITTTSDKSNNNSTAVIVISLLVGVVFVLLVVLGVRRWLIKRQRRQESGTMACELEMETATSTDGVGAVYAPAPQTPKTVS